MQTTSSFVKSPRILYYNVGLAILILVADYFSGPFIQFPFTYLIPISLAAYYSGRRWGLFFAVVMPLVRLYFHIALWAAPWTIIEAGINGLIRVVVFSAFAFIIDRIARQTRELSNEVTMLEGLLPICSHCKRIRDQNEEWQVLEKYIQDRTPTTFTHGICPECAQKHWGVKR